MGVKEKTEELMVVDISRYRKVKNDLKESEARYRLLFENMPIGIFRFSADGKILDANPALFNLLGHSSSAEIDQKNLVKKNKNILKILGEFCNKIENQHEFRSFDLTWRKKDNTPLYIRVNARVLSASDGKILFYEGTIEDISERRQAESQEKAALEMLAQQNDALSKLNRFSIALSMLPAAANLEVFIARQLKEITGAEAAVFSEYSQATRTITAKHIEIEPGLLEKVVILLGRQVEKTHATVSAEMYQEMTKEIIGMRRTLHEASFGAVSRPVAAAIQALLKVERFIGVAYIIEGKLYGTSLLAMSQGQPDLPKEILENFSFLAAVSLRRKLAESQREAALEALRESEYRYKSLIENIPDIIFTIDLEGKINFVSKRIKEILGYENAEMINMSIFNFIPEEVRQRAMENLQKGMRGEKIRHFQIQMIAKSGEGLFFECSFSRVYKNGAVVGAQGTAVDISERKRVESQREAASEALRVALVGKEVLLKEVHHRVKNNLAAIAGMLQLQCDTLTDPAAVAQFSELEGRIRSMALVHETLYNSENLTRIELQGYLESLIVKLRAALAPRRNMRISVAAAGVEMGLDNAIPCGLILNELITNALKYAFPGDQLPAGEKAPEITIAAKWDGNAEDDGVYTLTVADNGVGLPEGLDWATSKTLGLRLVRMLGQYQLKGRIELDRANGTSFRLVFASRPS